MDPRPVVLVTGAARRLGRHIAIELARHGWDVAVHFRGSQGDADSTVTMLHAAGARGHAFRADLADEAECEALLPAVLAAFGRVDAVVNNAALFDADDLASVSHASLDRHWRANPAPALILARALQRTLLEQPDRARRGAVVNLLDQKLWNPNPDHLSYTLSKAALECATTLLAQALAPTVRVCGVAPGLTLGSEMIDAKRLAALQAATPLQRGVTPDDIARSVRFLLENPSITGTTLLVDGGSHLAPMARDFAFHHPPTTGTP